MVQVSGYSWENQEVIKDRQKLGLVSWNKI